MTTTYKTLAWVNALLVVVALIAVGNINKGGLGGLVHNVQETFDEGIAVDGTEVISGTGDFAATDDLTVADDATITGDVSVGGETVVDGFTQGGGCLATSTTATTHTVTEAQLLTYNCFEVTWNTSSGTWTLPATSTLTTLIPAVGDMRSWWLHNATGTAAVTHTWAAGTGIDLVAYTTNDDVIDGNEFSELSCIRQTDTDVTCKVSEILHSD